MKELPHWWSRPLRDPHETLFSFTPGDVLADLRISNDEAHRWRSALWLSFDPSDLVQLSRPQELELTFLRDLARSGLGHDLMGNWLARLDRPFQYDSARVAFSFTHGWVQAPPTPEPDSEEDEQDPFEILEDFIDEWIEQTASEDPENLRAIRDRIDKALAESTD